MSFSLLEIELCWASLFSSETPYFNTPTPVNEKNNKAFSLKIMELLVNWKKCRKSRTPTLLGFFLSHFFQGCRALKCRGVQAKFFNRVEPRSLEFNFQPSKNPPGLYRSPAFLGLTTSSIHVLKLICQTFKKQFGERTSICLTELDFKSNFNLFPAVQLYQDPNIRVLHLLIVWSIRLNHPNPSINGWEIGKSDDRNLYGGRVGDNTLNMTSDHIDSPELFRGIQILRATN